MRKFTLCCLLILSFLKSATQDTVQSNGVSKPQNHIQDKFLQIGFEARSPFDSLPTTMLIQKDAKIFNFGEVLQKQIHKPINQKIANFTNQIYYSMRLHFDFCEQLFIQTGKIFRKINIQQFAQRGQGKRVRVIFIGFQY